MSGTEPSMTQMALYKMCREVYLQHQAQHANKFSDALTKMHDDVETYLDMTVDEFDGDIIVTFVLKRRDLNG